jgi:hypothetical protein
MRLQYKLVLKSTSACLVVLCVLLFAYDPQHIISEHRMSADPAFRTCWRIRCGDCACLITLIPRAQTVLQCYNTSNSLRVTGTTNVT